MGKINLKFITEHADLYRDEGGQLIVNLKGVEEDAVTQAIADHHAIEEANAEQIRKNAERQTKMNEVLDGKVE